MFNFLNDTQELVFREIFSHKNSFGRIFDVQISDTQSIIVKKYNNNDLDYDEHYDYYANEINFLTYLRNSNLVPKLYGHNEVQFMIALEKFDGDVESLLYEISDIDILHKIISDINQLLFKLNFEYGVVHNDMKYNNILYRKIDDYNYEFVFIDFSFSCIQEKIPRKYKETKEPKEFIINKNYEKFEDLFPREITNKRFRNWLGCEFTRKILMRDSIGPTEDIRSLYFDMSRIMTKKQIDKNIFGKLFDI